MNMRIEGDTSFSYEFNPLELVVDANDIYERSLELSKLEVVEKESGEDVAYLEDLRKIKGYIGGYELDYRIEGFDFVKLNDKDAIQLLTFLSPLIDEYRTFPRLFHHGEVYSLFKRQLREGKGVGGNFELKIHEFDDSGDEFVTEDHFYILHPIVTSIWEPYKIESVKKVLEENPEREIIDLS